jgi:hypothetical protein
MTFEYDEDLASFFAPDDEALRLADRSALEMMSVCPAQARYVASGAVNNSSQLANSGQELHDCLSQAIASYVDSGGQLTPTDLMAEVENAAFRSRPDVHPDVIRASKPILWSWSNYVAQLHPFNILRFDGGQGDRSGQLAFDLNDLRLRVTSELDLLHAGPAAEQLHEVDYKTGHKLWSARDVRDSFQFMLHAALVFENYPDVQSLEVRVWNTRLRRMTWGVEFDRRKLGEFRSRLYSVAKFYAQWQDAPPDEAPAWPAVEKCEICAAAALCPLAGRDVGQVHEDPAGFVDRMVAVDAKLKSMRRLASAWVKATGEDIVTPLGNAFGVGKPKANREPLKSIYRVPRGTEDAEEGESQEESE